MAIRVFFIIAVMVWGGSTAAQLGAEVVPRIEYDYYEVSPERGRTLSMSLFNATPVFHEGKTFAGLTKSDFGYRYDTFQPVDDVCQLQNIEVTANCLITLPRLTNADPQLSSAFAKYLESLKAHELEHCRITTYFANEFEQYLLKAGEDKCQAQRSAIEAEYGKVIDELNREQQLYDRRTVHGKYEGADLNKHLEAMGAGGSAAPASSPAAQTPSAAGGGGLRSIEPGVIESGSGIYKDKNGVWRNY